MAINRAVMDQANTILLRQKLAEIPVGLEPRCVAIAPDNQRAFVTNAVDGTVSVVSLVNFTVLATIPWVPSRVDAR